MHQLLVTSVKKLLGLDVDVGGPENWQRRSINGDVRFAFRWKPATPPIVALHEGGEEVHVFPLLEQAPTTATVWFSWSEEWFRKDVSVFDLTGAQLAFYWGPARVRDKRLVLRAEWDRSSNRGPNSAQPHWHVEHFLLAEFDRSQSDHEEDEPIDLDAEAIFGQEPATQSDSTSAHSLHELDPSGMHLAMGGWSHPGAHPRCWQREVSEAAELRVWMEQTLTLARGEFGRLKVVSV